MKNYLYGFVLAVTLGCLIGMDQTGRGFLVEQTYIAKHFRSPTGMLQCRYVVGFEILLHEVRFDANNFKGRNRCKIFSQFSEQELERLRWQAELRRAHNKRN